MGSIPFVYIADYFFPVLECISELFIILISMTPRQYTVHIYCALSLQVP
uniref:Uncharacterized protein n=1 Tax=Anguilla anguilla TaxID=7936 RepID=A0A0E9VJC1_ANGAN